MIDFDDVHRRFWRDHGGDSDAAIPVTGGDWVEKDGQSYAVLFDCDRGVVAVYQLAGGTRLMVPAPETAVEVGEMARKQNQWLAG